MPPKNTTKLNPGDVYFHAPEGTQQLYPLDEIPYTEESETDWPKENPYIKPATGATLTAELQISPDVDYADELCSLVEFEKQREAAIVERASPRVRHLAKYGKKYRTRKKNINRAWREYQKEDDK